MFGDLLHEGDVRQLIDGREDVEAQRGHAPTTVIAAICRAISTATGRERKRRRKPVTVADHIRGGGQGRPA